MPPRPSRGNQSPRPCRRSSHSPDNRESARSNPGGESARTRARRRPGTSRCRRSRPGPAATTHPGEDGRRARVRGRIAPPRVLPGTSRAARAPRRISAERPPADFPAWHFPERSTGPGAGKPWQETPPGSGSTGASRRPGRIASAIDFAGRAQPQSQQSKPLQQPYAEPTPRRYLSPHAGENHGYLSDLAMKPKCRVRRSGRNRNAPDPARGGDRGEIVAPASGGSRSRRDRKRKADAEGG